MRPSPQHGPFSPYYETDSLFSTSLFRLRGYVGNNSDFRYARLTTQFFSLPTLHLFTHLVVVTSNSNSRQRTYMTVKSVPRLGYARILRNRNPHIPFFATSSLLLISFRSKMMPPRNLDIRKDHLLATKGNHLTFDFDT